MSRSSFTKSVRRFAAFVTYRNSENKLQEEEFPVLASDHQTASRMALNYTLSVLKLDDFELRVVGA